MVTKSFMHVTNLVFLQIIHFNVGSGHWRVVAIIPDKKQVYLMDPLNLAPPKPISDLMEVALHEVNDDTLIPFELIQIAVTSYTPLYTICKKNLYSSNQNLIPCNSLNNKDLRGNVDTIHC